MAANQLYEKYREHLVEIRFMEGTESFKKYGAVVGGFLGWGPQDGNKPAKGIVPEGINLNDRSLKGSTSYEVWHKLSLSVNAGCKQVYHISEDNVEQLKKEGFSIFDIEANGIKIIKRE